MNNENGSNFTGEDKIFLIEAVMVLTSDRESIIRWLRNKEKSDRLLSIRTKLGSEGFEDECKKLKEVIES